MRSAILYRYVIIPGQESLGVRYLLRENRIRKAVKEGRVALGIGTQVYSPVVIELAGFSGLDFVWIDLEHGGFSPYDSTSLETLFRAADSVGVSPLVRIPSCDEYMIGKVLDAGAHSIIVPGVTEKKEVEKFVAASKFSPPGQTTIRGAGIGRGTSYRSVNKEIADWSDAQIMAGIMIENRIAVEKIEEIISVPGLDFAFIGPLDLSVSLGVHYQTSDPLVQSYISKAHQACRAKGLPLGTAVPDIYGMKKAVEQDYEIVRAGIDSSILLREFQTISNEYKDIVKSSYIAPH